MTTLPADVGRMSPEEKRLLLERLLREKQQRGKTPPSAARERLEGPLSFPQGRLFFLDRLRRDDPYYNVAAAVQLRGALDLRALASAFDRLQERHQILRTAFKEQAGEPLQHVLSPRAGLLRTVDLRGLPAAQRVAEGELQAREVALRPFHLGEGHLIRPVLLRLDEEESVLVLVVHHIAVDGWSFGLVEREISALYTPPGASADLHDSLPILTAQYLDFAVWQREKLVGERLDVQRRYWSERLAGLDPAELPADRPREAAGTAGATHFTMFPGSSIEELRQLARAHEATAFMALLSVFQILLHRYTGHSNPAVGTPITNRTREEFEDLIGFFANTLCLSGRVTPETTFTELLVAVHQSTLEAYQHAEMPFELVVEELRPERHSRTNPFFSVAFAHHRAEPFANLALSNVTATPWRVDFGLAKLELEFHLAETDAGLLGGLLYQRDLFDHTTIARFADHFQRLLEAAIQAPDRPIGELALMSAAQRQQLTEWNDTAVSLPEASLSELFERQAARRGAAPAVEFDGVSLSYGELNSVADLLARRLRSWGVRRGDRVGLCLGRSPEMVIGVLATLKAQAAYLPLDSGYPSERLAYMVTDAKAKVVLTEPGREDLDELFAAAGVTVRSFAASSQSAEGADPSLTDPLPDAVSPGDAAYVMYTSGSTGRPKGTVIPQRAVARLVLGARYLPIRVGQRMGHLSNVSFDAATFEIWGALLNGGVVVGISPEKVFDPAALTTEIRSRQLDYLFLTSALFHRIADESPAAFSSLQQLMVGGEVVDPRFVRRVLVSGPPLRLLNGYGPTETTTFATSWRVLDVKDRARSVPIGRALANTQTYVLGEDLRPVPPGSVGELHISGPGLALGYLDRPRLTAERFVPGGGEYGAGERLYKTGDLARVLYGGEIDLLGRRDQQIKLRGFRIELEEIAATLAEHPEIRQAVVLVRGEGIERRLVAYGSAASGKRPGARELRDFLAARLPDYMLPAAFVILDELPLTSNGKIDRRALREIGGETLVVTQPRAPRTAQEELLAGIWAEALGLEQIGVEDDFFALGGHSLLAVKIVSLVRESLGVEISIGDIYEGATVAELARRLASGSASGEAAPPLTRSWNGGAVPLSFSQQRLWLLDQLHPDSVIYNIPAVFELEGTLDEAALEAALASVTARHGALRTVVRHQTGDAAEQVVLEPEPWTLPKVDLQALPDAARALERRRLERVVARTVFNLGRYPLWRLVLLQLSEERYRLLFNLHHILGDGWSIGIWLEELTAFYRGFCSGEPTHLPELPLQYPDYALWQRRWLNDDVLESELAFWGRQLADLPNLELPTDRPRPREMRYFGEHRIWPFSSDLASALRRLGRERGMTFFMVFAAGLGSVLARWSGQLDIPLGTAMAQRSRPEVQGLIGFLVNTLVLRFDLGEDPRFEEILARSRRIVLDAQAHQEVPFDRLVEEFATERSSSQAPLFQVMLAMQNAPHGTLQLSGFQLTPIIEETGTGTSRFDLTIGVFDSPDEPQIQVEYSTELFDGTTIERLLRHFERLLTAAAADPELRLAELPVLDRAGRHQLMIEWNDTAASLPDASLSELFERQAALRGSSPALDFGGVTMSYGELAERSRELTRRLLELGVGDGEFVGLCLERSPEMVMAILGTLGAGAAYLPLDPGYPPERLAFVAEDSGLRLVVVAAGTEELFSSVDVPVVSLDDVIEVSADSAGPVTAANTASSGAPAYLMYTSGSTGRPKGTVVTQRAVVRLVLNASYLPISAGMRVGHLSNVSFDAATFEIWGALLNGGVVVGIAPEKVLDPAALTLEIRSRQLDYLFITTALFHRIADESPAAFSSLRQLMFGGEVADPRFVRRVLASGPPQRLLHVYGPTETTTFATGGRVLDVKDRARSVPIGRALANTWTYVLGKDLRPVPPGSVGELHLGGPGLALGYLNRPQLTAERFVPRGGENGTGERLYKTGDLVRHLPDGRIDFLGRRDNQVKLRGFRIELGEIEATVLEDEAIRQAAVAVSGEGVGRRLVAYIVAGGSATPPSPLELRSRLADRLPDYMLPGAFVPLEELPLTANGKLDRRALPDPQDHHVATRRQLAPRTEVEELLVGIWAEVLELETVDVHDDFFELGGHSLLAVTVVSRVHEVLGVEIELGDVFEDATVARMAERLRLYEAAGSEVPPLVPRERAAAIPLSFAQQRLWFLDQLQPGSVVYNMPTVLELVGELDRGALEAALVGVVARHETFRTTFHAGPTGTPEQIVGEPRCRPLPLVDLSALSEAKLRCTLRRVEMGVERTVFELDRDPLWCLVLVRLAENRHRLLLNLHHILGDGWSIGVWLDELAAHYRAQVTAVTPQLPDLPVQYPDYAVWQREWLTETALEEDLEYWRHRLRSLPTLELPTDRPRPQETSHRGAHLLREIANAAALRRLGRERGMTLFMVLLAGFDALLARVSGQTDFPLGTVVAGRSRPELRHLIGFFVNTLVLRLDVSGNPTFEAILERSRGATVEALAHQELPFDRLVEEIAGRRSLIHAPLFQVMLAMQSAPFESLELPGLRLTPVVEETSIARSRFDLSLGFYDSGESVFVQAEYSTELFDGTTIERLLRQYERLLTAAVADPELRLAELPVLDRAGRHQLMIEWNDTAASLPDASLSELFERQAALRGSLPALDFGGVTMSYGELAERSHAFTRGLLELGVEDGEFVGLCFERSPEMVMAILGVLGAGAAYLPLDPGYPPKRLAFMAEDSGARLVVAAAEAEEVFSSVDVRVVSLDDVMEVSADSAGPVAAVNAGSPGAPAYLMYTSGSTGRPKGTVVTQRGVARLVLNASYLPISAGMRVGHVSNVSFDAATLEIWGSLLNGGVMVGIAPEKVVDPAALALEIPSRQLDCLSVTAAVFNRLADESPAAFSSLRQLIFGGEVADPHFVRRVLASSPPQRVLNAYGPTETTMLATVERVLDVKDCARSVPIGRAIANTRTYVLGKDLRPVPPGSVGELHLGGPGLALGYLNRPRITAERFVPGGGENGVGERLYKTGDLVRHLPDGRIDFLGRRDDQVKLRGFRIEPGEIEAILLEDEAIRQAAVAVSGEGVDRRLVAYIVAGGSATPPSPLELRSRLADRLPDYMLPGAFVPLEELPLTANGKLDRRALPDPQDHHVATRRQLAPRTEVEELLVGIWAEALGLETVGLHDDFFELGGHSLLAVTVVSRVQEVLGVEIELAAVFEDATVARMAERLRLYEAASSEVPPLVPRERATAIPLSFAQQRLWFLDQLQPGSVVYNMPIVLELVGELDRGALEAALVGVVARHETFRTTFHTGPTGTPEQIVGEPRCRPLPLVDLSDLSEAKLRCALRRVEMGVERTVFRLDHDPLWRLVLVRLAENRHRLLLNLHHILGDGWSIGVWLDELAAHYRAQVTAVTPQLPELPVQYPDYAVWQREWLTETALEEDLEYWRHRLRSLPTLELPTDRPRPQETSHRGAHLLREIANAAALRRLGRERGMTLFMVLLAGFDALLARVSGQNDFPLGTVVAGRSRPELRHLIGFFVNTLVLRLDVGGNPTFEAILERSRGAMMEALAHQELPFDRLVEEIAGQRSLSHAPLFQVMLAMQSKPFDGLELPGLRLTPVVEETSTARSRFDLSLAIYDSGESVFVQAEYSTELFDDTTIERLLRYFECLLTAAAADPELRLEELPLLEDAGRHQLLVEWNDIASNQSRPRRAHHLVAEHAARQPEAPALSFGDQRLTYGDLVQRSKALAEVLERCGAGPETVVAIWMDRSLEMVLAMLAVLESGAAFLLLDTEQPEPRLRTMVQDAAPVVVLNRHEPVTGLSIPRVSFDIESGFAVHDLASYDTTRRHPRVTDLDHLAYVVYTSGSTGRPKGVELTHRGLFNLATCSTYGASLGERATQVASPSFDAMIAEVWTGLCSGAFVHLAPSEVRSDPARLIGWLANAKIDVAFLPTPLLEAIVEEPWPEDMVLRRIETAGDRLRRGVVEALERRAPGLSLFNLYGPTESTVLATWGRVGPGLFDPSIGRPMDHLQALVLDERLQLAPIGLVGDLYLAGTSLARGYRRRAATTARSFVPHPFGGKGERLYRTGDRARLLANGEIDFVGRRDYQVKIRGQRIELDEIAATLREHSAVSEAVVVLSGTGNDRELAAYVVAPSAAPPASELAAFLRKRLPVAMVPATYVTLAELPRTPSGKIDRRALPAPDSGERPTMATFVAPRTPLEHEMAELWSQVLQVERIGIDDSFFDLGGHSLMAAKLVAAVRQHFEIELELRDIFSKPTVSQLAERVEHYRRTDSGADIPAHLPELVPRPEELHSPFPTTVLQQAYLLGRDEHFELGGVAAHGYFELEAEGWDLERINRAIRRLVERHPMLRTIFPTPEEQRVLEETPPFEIKIEDLRHLAPAQVEEHLADCRAEMSHRVFEADQWPLFDVRASLLGGGQTRLHIDCDGLIADTWSLGILGREIVELYANPELDWPPLELTFRDLVLAERALADSPAGRRSREYWSRRAAELPPAPELPLARNPESLDQPRFVGRSSRLGAEDWKAFKRSVAELGMTPSVALLAAFAEVLARWSKTPGMTLNLTTFNRRPWHPEVDRVVGDFTSLTLVGIDAVGSSFADRARRLQERLWDDLEHDHVDGVEVLRQMARHRGVMRGALMPVVFSSGLGQNQAGLPSESRDRVVYRITQTPQVWIDYQVMEVDGVLGYNWDVVEDLFPAGLIDDMLASHDALLKGLASSDAFWQAAAPITLPAAQLALYEDFNSTSAPSAPPSSSELLHDGFERQAQHRPEAPAVISKARTLDYGELELESRWLAHELQRLGAGRNRLVAVVMEKGWEQVVAVLGISRAGAAYLPIDAALPRERIWQLLSQGEVEVAVTTPEIDRRLQWPEVVERLPLVARSAPVPPLDRRGEITDLAYVIFTSGSTGKPKGVMIDHRGAVNTIRDINQRFDLGPRDRVLALSSLSFDLSVWDVFGLLAAGGAVVLPEPEARREPARWHDLLAQHQVTIWNTVPALLELLADYAESGTEMRLDGALRCFMMSGDWIPISLPDRLRRLAPEAELMSLGGATEGSIWSIYSPIGEVETTLRSIPYGRPMDHQHFYVLDGDLRPRPLHVPGELYIGGVGVALGYWRDAQRTAQRFLPHPETGERLYRTGDLGRMMSDGQIEFLGREDFQVKIQGYRVELGEIEATLEDHPYVAQAVVTAPSDEGRGSRLVAHVVLGNDAGPEQDGGPEQDAVEMSSTTLPAVVGDVGLPGVWRPRSEQLAGPAQTLQLKFGRDALRREEGGLGMIDLPAHGHGEEALRPFIERRTHRGFLAESVPFAELADLLSCLRAVRPEGSPLAKYRYPSAGHLYPIELYLHVKEERVEGLAAGLYLYHPHRHRLLHLVKGECITAEAVGPANRPIFDSAALALFLVADLRVVEPTYGHAARDLSLLEAGYMSQLLVSEASARRIGFCPVGGLETSGLRARTGLGEDHLFLHTLLGGRVPPAREWRLESWLDDREEPLALPTDAVPPTVQVPPISKPPISVPPVERVVPRPTPEVLRQHLADRLPAYMVPSSIVLLDALPLTANGKIDRAGLLESTPAPTTEAPKVSAKPQGPVEGLLAQLWADLLEVDEVSHDASFLELGGNSLAVMRLVSRIREAFDVDISAAEIFEASSLAGLAVVVENALESAPEDSPPPLRPASREGEIPLSYSQERHWVLHQLYSDSHLYTSQGVSRIHGTVRVDYLAVGFAEIVRRHEILRTSFHHNGGRPIQRVEERGGDVFRVIDLRRVEDPESVAHSCLDQVASELFDLECPPLMRAVLLRLGPEDQILALLMPHIVGDRWTSAVMMRELKIIYEALRDGHAPSLPSLPVQYADYALWQRRWLTREKLESQAHYWHEQLRGAPPLLEFSLARPRPERLGAASGVARRSVDPELHQRLVMMGRQLGVTLFQTLLAGFQILLRHFARGSEAERDDIVVGSPIAGRNRVETENLVGCFINALALRVRFDGDPSFKSILERVRRTVIQAYMHQDYPFENLVRELNPERRTNATPIFQVAFNFDERPLVQEEFADLHFEPWGMDDSAEAKYDLTLFVLGERGGGLSLGFYYSSDLFDPAAGERLASAFLFLLQVLVQDPELSLTEIDRKIDEEERRIHQAGHEARRSSRRARLGRTRRKKISSTANEPDSTNFEPEPSSNGA